MKREIIGLNFAAPFLAAIATAALTACGGMSGGTLGAAQNNLNSNSSTGGPSGISGGGASGGGAGSAPVQLNAAVSGGQYNNQHVISLDTANSQLVVTLPMPINPGISTGVQASLPIAQLPGASLGFQNLAPLGVSAVLKIPLRDIVHGLQTAAPQALPNGDPIPAVPSGELPAIAVQLSNIGSIGSTPITATIYMLETYIAIYVNSPVNPFISLTLPINESGKTVGYFSTVPAKSNTVQGGFFISFQLPADVSRWIDSNFQ